MLHCLVQSHPKQWDDFLGQAKFVYNLISNRSTGNSLFSIVYTKAPNHTIDIVILPICINISATIIANNFYNIIEEIRHALQNPNDSYNLIADWHKRAK